MELLERVLALPELSLVQRKHVVCGGSSRGPPMQSRILRMTWIEPGFQPDA